MKVWIDGSEQNLTQKNWVTSGGEADIYKIKNKALKLFKNPRDRFLEERLSFFKGFKCANIAKLETIIRDNFSNPIGVVMPWLDGDPLLMAFNNNWRADHKIDDALNAEWTLQMRSILTNVLNAGARMVDANEWNYLIKDRSIWAIDVDSWCLPGMHATAQMPSIKDWHSQVESVEAEWFAAAIVTFQLWTGIHPYKGNIDGFKKGDFVERMKQNISVLHNGVRVPSVTRNWNNIPKGLYNWYYEVFEHGSRNPMPDKDKWSTIAISVVNTVFKTVVKGSLQLTMIHSGIFKQAALLRDRGFFTHGGQQLKWLNTGVDLIWESSPDTYTGIKLEAGNLILRNEFNDCTIQDVSSYWVDGRFLWITSKDSLTVYAKEIVGHKVYFKQHARWPVGSNISRTDNVCWAYEFGGMLIWFSMDDSPTVQRIKVFDDYKIIKIKQCGKYLIALGRNYKSGLYQLMLYDTNMENVVFESEVFESAFNATSVGGYGVIIVVDDGEVWLWNGNSMSKTNGDLLLNDSLFSYRQKPYICRNGDVFKLSNKLS